MSWASDISRASKALEIGIGQFVRLLALYIYGGVIRRTPVDMGHLRAAWNLSVDQPEFITTPGTRGSGNLGALGAYPVVYITNGLPYAAVVEYGLFPGVGPLTVAGSNPSTGSGIFSRKAPAGMVEVTLAEVRLNLRRVVANL